MGKIQVYTRFITGGATLILMLACSGCAPVLAYVTNRGSDFADIFVVEASIGLSAEVHAQVTKYVGTCLGAAYQPWGVRLEKGDVMLIERFGFGIGVIGYFLSAPRDEDDAPYPGSWYYSSSGGFYGWLVRIPGHALPEGPEWPDNYNIEVGGCLMLGTHVGFNPIEFVDFLLGFVAVDILDDDSHPSVRQGAATRVRPTMP